MQQIMENICMSMYFDNLIDQNLYFSRSVDSDNMCMWLNGIRVVSVDLHVS